jgi:hypothetical protein
MALRDGMTEKQQRVCIGIGLAFLPLFWLGLVVAGWFPPPRPDLTALEVQRMFAADRTRIRVGVLILTSAGPLLACYGAALTHQIRRNLGPSSPLATAQSLVAACLILEFIFPQMIWQTAAYRGERNADLIQLCYDMGWLMYIGVVGTAMVQMMLCSAAIFLDRREDPAIPRWVAYVCMWSALGVAGGALCVFVQRGPLAWNGLIAFWLLAVAFFVWMLTMGWTMLHASRIGERDDAEPALAA